MVVLCVVDVVDGGGLACVVCGRGVVGVAEVDFVLECSTFHDRLVSVLVSINRHLLQVSNLVVGDHHAVIHHNLNIGAIFVCPRPEGVHEVVFLGDEEVVVEFIFISLSKSSLKLSVSWGERLSLSCSESESSDKSLFHL